MSAAHPRSRGEHAPSRMVDTRSNGSSPLARGTYPRGDELPQCPRLIPARAGNMAWMPGTRVARQAHPRSRGEHAA